MSGLVYGIVYFNGTCVADTTDLFLPAGQIKLNAIPYPGWVFYGWDINGFQTNASLTTYNLTVPANITPLFSIAKRVEFVTNPPAAQRPGGPNSHPDASPWTAFYQRMHA